MAGGKHSRLALLLLRKSSKLIGLVAESMKVSQKGLYALQALILLAHRFDGKSATKIHDIATADGLPENFLELILLELKHARLWKACAAQRAAIVGPHLACGSLLLIQAAGRATRSDLKPRIKTSAKRQVNGRQENF